MKPFSSKPALSAFYLLMIGLVGMAVLIGFFAWHSDASARAMDARIRPYPSVPGLAEPRYFMENDAYAWLSHTRDLLKQGGFRLRHTRMDNAPHGRAMHWSHPVIWTLGGLTVAMEALLDWPQARALEMAGVLAMPVLQFLFLSAVFILVQRKLGWIPAACLVFSVITLNGLSVTFHPLRPDHHGPQLFATLLAFISLQFGGMGWVRKEVGAVSASPSPWIRPFEWGGAASARRWMVASGIFGGVAAWLGGTVWIFSLTLMFVVSFASLPMFQRRPLAGLRYEPQLWLRWGGALVATTAVCYALEYLPHSPGMRLEVNHPTYWLYELGLAGVLFVFGCSRSLRFWETWHRKEWVLLAVFCALALVLPVIVLFGDSSWHSLRHPLMKQLHAAHIGEFQPGWKALRASPLSFFVSSTGILLLFPLAELFPSSVVDQSPGYRRLVLIPASVLAALYFALVLFQLRWGYFFSGALLWFAVLILVDLAGRRRARSLLLRLVVAVLLGNAAVAGIQRVQTERAIAGGRQLDNNWLRAALGKRVIMHWGVAARAEPWRWAGMTENSPTLYYFTGLPGLSSLYWENIDGWQAETDLFNDLPPYENARRIAQERGLTHLLALQHASFASFFVSFEAEAAVPHSPAATLARCLSQREQCKPPGWLDDSARLSELASQTFLLHTPSGAIPLATASRVFEVQDQP